MPFIKYNPDSAAIKFHESCKQVEQDRLEVAFFEKGYIQDEILLYTNGMNPCMGIILHGEVKLEQQIDHQESDETLKDTLAFEIKNEPILLQVVALYHHSGFDAAKVSAIEIAKTKNEEKGEINKIASEFFEEIMQDFSLKICNSDNFTDYPDFRQTEFTLLSSYFIRCKPHDINNLQHLYSETLVKSLKIPEKIREAMDPHDDETVIKISAHYPAPFCVEEPEQSEGDKNSSMECYLEVTSKGDLNVIYYHRLPNDLTPGLSAKGLQLHNIDSPFGSTSETSTKKSKTAEKFLASPKTTSPSFFLNSPRRKKTKSVDSSNTIQALSSASDSFQNKLGL